MDSIVNTRPLRTFLYISKLIYSLEDIPQLTVPNISSFFRYGWALRVAKYTAKTLLQIVSDKDYVAFYTFNLTTQSLSCYPQLERARLKYINHLYEEIDKIDAIG